MEVKKRSQSIPGIERVSFFFFFFLMLMLFSLPKNVCVCVYMFKRQRDTDRNIEKGDKKIESEVGVIN